MDRHQSRILAMQAACQLEAVGTAFLSDLDGFLADEGATGATAARARQLVEQVEAHLVEIDARIAAAAVNWEVKRLAPVDRAILRVAVCELVILGDTPPNVVINEAVEMGKAFGSAESGSFINGLLDSIARRLASERSGAAAPEGVPAPEATSEAPHGAV